MRCTLSDLESCVSVLLVMGGGVLSILLCGRLLSACLVRCVFLIFDHICTPPCLCFCSVTLHEKGI